MFAATAMLPEGYALIVDGLNYYKEQKKLKHRFGYLVECLTSLDTPITYKVLIIILASPHLTEQRSIFGLINALVNSPEDLTHR